MSCVDYLDKETDTELTLPLVFEDKTRIEGWLANVYSAIPDPYWGYTNTLGWEVLADDLTSFDMAYFFGACLTVVSTFYFNLKVAPHYHKNKLR